MRDIKMSGKGKLHNYVYKHRYVCIFFDCIFAAA